MSTTPLSRLQELLPQLFESTQLPGDRYLRFQLTTEISALFSMEYVQESLLVPSEQITPIPSMSASVIGLMNSRDKIFCVIDLGQLMGLSPLSTYTRQYHIVVVRVSQLVPQQASGKQELFLGMAVNQVQGISRIISDQLKSVQENTKGDFPVTLTPYLRGYVIEKEQQLLVLEMETIIKKSLEEKQTL
ncbi:MAG: chemotaxis protein CheW [Cyanobacteria bacterium P01_G01_bin.49]